MTARPTRPVQARVADVRLRRLLIQGVVLVAVAAAAVYLIGNVQRNLQQLGITPGFDFLRHPASFAIGETSIAYRASDPYGRAFLAGLVNTLRVSVLGVVLATVVGVTAGLARLSGNGLVRLLASLYVEVTRNTPLLLQLFFWYGAIVYTLPPAAQAITLPGSVFLMNRGLVMPAPKPGPGFGPALAIVLTAAVAAMVAYRRLLRRRVEEGRETRPGLVAAVLLAAGVLAAGFLPPGPPLVLDRPVLARFNFQGGLMLSAEFTALLLALVIYTGAFIAEVVRGGVLAVPRGQWEAAASLGLPPLLVQRLVVFPQALRIIIPPLTSQYLNLIKNSSLAMAVAFPDLLNVSSTIVNQTGRTLEVLLMVGGTYLAFSLLTSLLMNLYNRSLRRGVA
ncbi:amino acid ABC transporter membrane protein 1, PAAT family [Thermaerobacter marianensis DSM 12885]|uniref:Amino acid ABC transporter membrane protein 1, PAAT family n=1 Tax=Thermaerobacter marianensis (strain ATCC 700841 / DSM 12885 / JCM 10246 / 7p75a) TaxID=644966 RepID=E6SMQ8_THEM7|nr:ABC transporter permease subunit [Thermaerobacter marianensis]ADU51550.1 amino acid ABC transporter membrane protein 1, PAAT family [Thermaerobacter marianensis DSM 12885]